jgi:hypothetical protein
MKRKNFSEGKLRVDESVLTSQDTAGFKFSPDTDGFFKNDDAEGVLEYLLTEVRYKPDDPNFSMRDAVEFGFPTKPRFMLRDGDYAINDYSKTMGYYLDKNKWVAFDNSTGDCWVEEFESEELALSWLKGELDINYGTTIYTRRSCSLAYREWIRNFLRKYWPGYQVWCGF